MAVARRLRVADLPRFVEQVEERIRANDRRREDRTALEGSGVAVFNDRDGGAKICKIDFVDASGTGLGVVCGLAVEPGTPFMFRPDSGLKRAHSGRVVRCIREGDRYRMGLALSIAKAA